MGKTYSENISKFIIRKTSRCLLLIFIILLWNNPALAHRSVEAAISWAQGEIGNNWDDECGHPWAWWCLHFIGHAYDEVPTGFANAITAWNDNGSTFGPRQRGIPPRGALVFFKASASNNWDGHVGFCIGNRIMIHAWTTGVRKDCVDSGGEYLGWRWPNSWTPDFPIFPLSGDWDGDGSDTFGYFENNVFYLDNGQAVPFGIPGDYPIIGDWDGDGRDDIGVFRAKEEGLDQSTFYLELLNDGELGGLADYAIPFGYWPDDIPVVGDWDGDGDDDIGGYYPANSVFYLFYIDLSTSTAYSYTDVSLGQLYDYPVIGDWDCDGDDDLGIFRTSDPNENTNNFYFDINLTGGQAEYNVTDFGSNGYGNIGDIPITGDWDGDGDDNIGVYRPSDSGAPLDKFYTNSSIPDIAVCNNPPDTPSTPSGPSEGYVGTNYSFSTSATDPDKDPVSYRFDWGDGNISSWGSSTQSHSWNSPDTYAVKAQAKDSHGATSPWSSGITVTISACLAPSTPSNPTPTNGAIGISIDTDLDWTDCTNATSYDVYFNTNSPPLKVGTVTSSFYDLGTLNYNTIYYWKIVAKNDCGETSGPEWNFKTQSGIVQYTLTISTTTGGTTNPAPGSYQYDSGTQVQVEAIPDSGYEFSQWSGDIHSDHKNDNPLTIVIDSNKTLTANFIQIITLPEINIKQDAESILDGGSYDFGSLEVGTYTDVMFTIENTGTADLTLSGSPIITITGIDVDQFSVQQQPASLVASGDSTTFIIRFSPTSEDSKTASILISNNDADENPYDITLNGMGVVTIGSLMVTIEPQGARDAGAQWRRLGTVTWNDSGYTESGISAGDVIVEFKEIAGWIRPANQTAMITARSTTNVTGIYTQVGGTGIFIDSGQSLGTSSSRDVALEDIDRDGDFDAFVVNDGQPNKVWLNDGTGTFTDSGQNLGSAESVGVALGDVDGDGDLDAFIANYGQPNKVWLNGGIWTFFDSGQTLDGAYSWGVALGDVDGDGDLDAFVVNDGQANKVWLNDGTGTFTDSGQNLGSAESVGVALGDVDGDSDFDAFVVNDGQPNKVWLNDGTGAFTDSGQSLGSSNSVGVALGDVDGDGDLDGFIANHSQPNKVWLNDGTGAFTDSGQSLGNNACSWGVVLGDVGGDGDLDAFIANSGQPNKVWLNGGNGTFFDSGQILDSAYSLSVALGDVGGDGDLDAFIANSGQPNKVWLNECISPTITTQPQSQTIDYNTSATLSVTATGTAPLSHQWYQGTSGDTSAPVGTNSSSYTTPNLTATTLYWVKVSNACGSVDSNTATITVNPPQVLEINIKVETTDIVDGGSYDFGSHDVGTDTDVTFTIENTGTANLILIGSPIIAITGPDAGQFSIEQQPTSPIPAGNSTTFIIRFSPTSINGKTASISIVNNDSDENPYDVILNGTAFTATDDDNGPFGKKCFIATAAYGSPLHSYVRILRDFKDKYLMPSKLGRVLINFYYKYSRSVADLIVKHKVLKVAVRINLLPLIALSYSMLHFGPIMTAVMLVLIFIFPIFFILFCRRKLRRVLAKDPKALASR